MNRGDRVVINDTFPIEQMVGSFATIVEVYNLYVVVKFDIGTPIADPNAQYNLMKDVFTVIRMTEPSWEV